MIDLLIYVAILVIIVVTLYWLIGQAGLPEPIGKVVTIVLVVLAVVVLIYLLLSLGHHAAGVLR